MKLSSILIITIILLFQIFNLSCRKEIRAKVYWEKVGEINVQRDSLEVLIKDDSLYNNGVVRFYFAPLDRYPDGNKLNGVQIKFIQGYLLSICEENAPGRFEKNLYLKEYKSIKKGEMILLKIPTQIFVKEKMRFWSAYDRHVLVNNKYELQKPEGVLNDKTKPYQFILITQN
jgi:hypothetical protein